MMEEEKRCRKKYRKIKICDRCGQRSRKLINKVCENCDYELNEEQESHNIVTHEMAMDACDLSLEGQII